MYFTPFFPIFLALAIYALRSANAWAIAMGIACFFQAASPILVVGGGRVSGIAPAYALMFVGLWHVYGHLLMRRDRKSLSWFGSGASNVLLVFSILAILGAVLLPRVFQGGVQVLPPREGLDSGLTFPLSPSGTNYIQAFYVGCILLLFTITRYLCGTGLTSAGTLVRGVALGAGVSVLLGFYQLGAHYLGLPWPGGIINSNLGLPQLIDQTALGLKRMSATFLEPSQMAAHYLGALGLVALGLRKRLLGVLILAALLISTSSTAYFGLLLLMVVWVAFDLRTRAHFVLPTLAAICVIVGFAAFLDAQITDGRLAQALIFEKFDSGSGAARLNADFLAIQTLWQSYGFGAGVGSARASTLPATLAATTGVPGLLLFLTFAVIVVRQSLADTSDQGRAVSLALIGLLIGWTISIPDLNFPLFWLLAAASGHSATSSVLRRSPVPLSPVARETTALHR